MTMTITDWVDARKRLLTLGLAAAFLLVTIPDLTLCSSNKPVSAESSDSPIPVLAYYYIWYTPSSWNRAKTDYPSLGRYDSIDRAIMRQHIRWAKEAGLDGFVVSWKSTTDLNDRLERLILIAGEEDFKLAIIYQGLDFERRPLEPARVSADLELFSTRFAGAAAFSLFSKPMVIWSGSWEFTREEIASVTAPHRPNLLILASEKNANGITRLTGIVDGNAYYWSSVNPETFPGYEEKLQEMAELVHADGGLWIAPAAPGFDARQVGGTRVVDRHDGLTLRTQFDAATLSSPDAIGIISWNEFSENSHIEPSEIWGFRYLEVLADILGGEPPAAEDFDSSSPAATSYRNGFWFILAALALLVGGVLAFAWRNRR